MNYGKGGAMLPLTGVAFTDYWYLLPLGVALVATGAILVLLTLKRSA